MNQQGLWHCFGCQEKGDIFKFIQLQKNCTFSEAVNFLGQWGGMATPSKSEEWFEVESYYYPKYLKRRYETESGKKKFAFFHVAGDSVKAGRNSDPDIYNRELAEKSTTLCFTEGEKCANYLTKIGLTGVTLDAGAGSPIPSCLPDIVKGKRVVIFPDNDKTGKEYAERVANACSITAGIVTILTPELLGLKEEKDDIIEWSTKENRLNKDKEEVKDELIDLIRKAPKYNKTLKIYENSEVIHFHNGYHNKCIHYMKNGYTKVLGVGIKSFEGIYGWVSGLCTTVSGIPNNGKTSLVETIICNLAKLHGHRTVVFSGETMPPERWVLNMVPKWTGRSLRKLTTKEIEKSINEMSEYFILLNPDEDKGHKNIEWILATAKKIHDYQPIQSLYIDPWSELDHPKMGQQGAGTETLYISWALSFIRKFARTTGIHCFVVAHPTKPNFSNLQDPKDYTKINPYMIAGSAQWYNKADFVLLVSSGLDKEGNRGDPVISVSKVRFREHGKLSQVTLKFDHETGSFIDPPEDIMI